MSTRRHEVLVSPTTRGQLVNNSQMKYCYFWSLVKVNLYTCNDIVCGSEGTRPHVHSFLTWAVRGSKKPA